jgi:tetratricopeptide (TPR) repeat protein
MRSTLLLLVIAIGASTALAGSVADAERLLAEGKAAEAADVARSLLEQAGETAPTADLAALHSVLARALWTGGDAQASLPEFEDALRLRESPEDRLSYAEALISVARANLLGGNVTAAQVVPYLDDAVASAEKARGPEHDRRRLRAMGEARYWRGDLEESARLLREAAPKPSEGAASVRALEALANALYRLGRPAEAAAAFHEAGNVRGEASAWAAAKDGAKAIPLYAQLLATDPNDESLLAEAMQTARYADARPLLADALAAASASPSVVGRTKARLHHAQGVLARESNDLAASAARRGEAAAADPTWSAPLVELGKTLLSGSEPPVGRVVALWLEALGRDASDASAKELLWFQAGQDYTAGTAGGGDPKTLQRSIEVLRALAAADPEDPLVWANLGNTLRVAGEPEAAVEAYRKAEELNPYDAAIVSDHGLALSGAGRRDEALAAFERAAELDASSTATRQNGARVRWLRGEDDAAEKLLGEAAGAARAQGEKEMMYRFLLDRVWRARNRPEVR